MNPRYQIFVSSTFQDLKDARERVIYELMRNGFIAVGMEQFHASDEEQMDYIRPLIDQADYYVVIVKGRYGSLSNDGLSYTEREYRYAVEKGVPVLAFLFDDLNSISLQDTDNDPEKLKKFKEFRSELSSRRIVSFWKTDDELVSKVKDAVFSIIFRKPGIGWVRGDQAIDPQVYKELEGARKKIQELSDQLGAVSSGSISFPEGIAHGSDTFPIDAKIDIYSMSPRKIVETTAIVQNVSWDELLQILTDRIYIESSEGGIANELREFVLKQFLIKREMDRNLVGVSIDHEMVKAIRFQFEALGLITTATRTESAYVCWRLTEKGRFYISRLRAIRRDIM